MVTTAAAEAAATALLILTILEYAGEIADNSDVYDMSRIILVTAIAAVPLTGECPAALAGHTIHTHCMT